MNKTTSSLIEPNQKLRNLEQEKAQAEHRSQRLQNRERYLSEGARKKRTHHLCNMGGAIEALCPQIAALNKADFYRVMKRIFALSEVQDILLDMTLEGDEDDVENIRFAFADENQIAHDRVVFHRLNKADGTVSFLCFSNQTKRGTECPCRRSISRRRTPVQRIL